MRRVKPVALVLVVGVEPIGGSTTVGGPYEHHGKAGEATEADPEVVLSSQRWAPLQRGDAGRPGTGGPKPYRKPGS